MKVVKMAEKMDLQEQSQVEQNAKVFKALCDPKRLGILQILREGEHCACDIIAKTGIAQSALSYHMKILVESTLVDSWQVGKWTHYQISDPGRENALVLLETLLKTEESTGKVDKLSLTQAENQEKEQVNL